MPSDKTLRQAILSADKSNQIGYVRHLCAVAGLGR